MVTLAPILSATLQRDCVCCSIGVMMSSHGVGLMFVSFKLTNIKPTLWLLIITPIEQHTQSR